MATQTEIIKTIAENLSLEPTDLDKNALLREDLNLGPLELNDLLANLSAQFDIILEAEELSNLKTVEDLIILIEDNSI